ncbi:MAG: hypothetical protein ACTH2Q_20660 [Propionibacteriaceae bacterium]
MTDERIAVQSRRYGPLLDQVQEAVEDLLGPLLWQPRSDTHRETRRDGRTVTRVGPVDGEGVSPAQVDPAALTEAVNAVLVRHGFPAGPTMTGSESGHLVLTSTDTRQAVFEFTCKGSARACVDVAD